MIPQEIGYLKVLDLITPERAGVLGVTAEAPVCTSPIVKERKVCEHCQAEYAPIIYPRRGTTRAQHFHQDIGGSGGIYIYTPNIDVEKKLNDMHFRGGVVAEVQAIEPVIPGREQGNILRAPGIEILRVHVFTYSPKEHRIIELTEGCLVEEKDSLETLVPKTLIPVPFNEVNLSRHNPYCNFTVAPDGSLAFFALEQ